VRLDHCYGPRLDHPGPHEHVLAVVTYGNAPVRVPPRILTASIPLDPLDGGPVAEVWKTGAPATLTEEEGFQLAFTDEVMFGFGRVDRANLLKETRSIYQRLLQAVGTRGWHLLRVWNTIPGILQGPDNYLKYMEFCEGRAEAFEAYFGPGFESTLCACSAVGSSGGPQTLTFLAAKERGEPHENPRQVSAYCYPRRYGPRSPSFARAVTATGLQGAPLFLSGTASITGHESVHLGDVAGQTLETTYNLKALLGQAGRVGSLKVYMPRTEHHEVIQANLDQHFGYQLPKVILRADLCRPELLVEIEGIGER